MKRCILEWGLYNTNWMRSDVRVRQTVEEKIQAGPNKREKEHVLTLSKGNVKENKVVVVFFP